MKLYMLCDMEGCSGIYLPEQIETTADRPELYQEGRKLMTLDVNSAAQAALDAGVDELWVADTHNGGGVNIFWDQVLVDDRIIYEAPQVSTLMPSLDQSFDGLILLGHHAKAGTLGAFLDHTWSSEEWFDFQINGVSVGEIGIETCYAGHWNVPLIMVQGDAACCREVNDQFPWAITAEVKRAVGRNRAAGPAPELARRRTAEKVKLAVEKLREGHFKPYRPDLPMTIRFTATRTSIVESIARKPNVHRIDGRTVEARVDLHCDILRWLTE